MEDRNPSTRDITEEMLKHFWELDQRRKALDRESATLEKAQKVIADTVKAALAFENRTDVRRGIYRAELRDGAVSPKWKEAFLALAGPEKVAEVTAETPPSKRLTVMRLEAAEEK